MESRMDRRRFLAASAGAGAALMGAQLKSAPAWAKNRQAPVPGRRTTMGYKIHLSRVFHTYPAETGFAGVFHRPDPIIRIVARPFEPSKSKSRFQW